VQCWGNNEQGQLGNHSDVETNPAPVNVTDLTYGVESIAARGGHTCAVLSEGKTVCWGNNAYGELGDGTAEIRNEPVPVEGLPEDIIGLYAGWNYSCALSSGEGLLCWGRNTYGQLGDGTKTSRLAPTRIVDTAVGLEDVDLGWRHSCIVRDPGGVECWGADEYGQIRVDPLIEDLPPPGTDNPARTPTLERTNTPTNTSSPKVTSSDPLMDERDLLAAGSSHMCMITERGGVLCWGGNAAGQLGDGTNVDRWKPVPVRGMDRDVIAISAGGDHTCAVLADGRVFCWGANYSGEMGDGTVEYRNEPVAVKGLDRPAVAVAAGGGHTCALLDDSRVACWGANNNGQLGSQLDSGWLSTRPKMVEGLPGAVQSLDSLFDHTCAITDEGAVYCWGLNDYGQLGDGSTSTRYSAVPVTGLSDAAVSIATGRSHTCAILRSGKTECWGSNRLMQLGDEYNFIDFPNPIERKRLGGRPLRITAGFFHTCQWCNNQGVECWGLGGDGQLGYGKNNSSAIPKAVLGLDRELLDLRAGEQHTCMLLPNWDVYCWGRNDHGQLGNGSNVNQFLPVLVEQ
jgi:alpha-tubulin suppressor-like RCC1 family protein